MNETTANENSKTKMTSEELAARRAEAAKARMERINKMPEDEKAIALAMEKSKADLKKLREAKSENRKTANKARLQAAFAILRFIETTKDTDYLTKVGQEAKVTATYTKEKLESDKEALRTFMRSIKGEK